MRLAVTLGDPRGIGPEVMLGAAREVVSRHPEVQLRLLGARESLGDAPQGPALEPVGDFDGTEASAGAISLEGIRKGVGWALAGEVDGIVTGPVSKPALHAAGTRVPGQTELLGELTGASRVGMLMCAETTRAGGPLRILLVTTHLPLREVPEVLTSELLEEQGALLSDSLRKGWGIREPRIALCALNPHASDGGLFGDEEARILAPAVERLRSRGVSVEGPLPADTVFLRALEGRVDAVMVPYHDVGMAVFKTLAFGRGVNVTLGLPFVRTSPDHGTAFDIAGTGRADPGSAVEAMELAIRLAGRRNL
jgi:4-hydroxythreonine-4-phosphate dehydrogenase